MTDYRTPENMREDEVVGEEELVAADDAIIGKAFVWSIVVFIIIGTGIAGMVMLMNRPEAIIAREARAFVPPKTIEAPATAPVVKFTDITSAAGIDFVHESGATGNKLLPETMGGGCAFFDFDLDGDQDILLVNSRAWPEDSPGRGQPGAASQTHALYRNDGRGTFVNVTSESGLEVSSYGMGAACGDYDNDGDADVFISNVGANLLFRNEGSGRFTNVTEAAGVAGGEQEWSSSCGFLDYNNDGRLDLFVCNYVKWSREIDFQVNFTLTGVGRAYGPPTNFEGTNNYLYKNNGDGTFSDVSEAAGIHVSGIQGRPMGKALGVVFADVDRDGWMDIFVANDTVRRFFFHNQKDGTFAERGAEYGLAYDRGGNATGAMGVDCAAYRNDDSLGFVIGNFANEMSSLLVSQNSPTQFSDEAITEGIGAPTRASLTFGAFFFDYDLDGRLDLLHANGHIEDQINVVQSSQQYRQPAQLFWNAGPLSRMCFVAADAVTSGDLMSPLVGRGAAYADIDSDGDLDLLLTQVNGRPMLLRNELERRRETASVHGGDAPSEAATEAVNWIRIRLVGDGTTSNRDAIGARIELTAGGIAQTRTVMPTRSYLSQVELPVTFGLGEAETIESLRIIWPDGSQQQIESLDLNTTVVVQQAGRGESGQ